MGLFEEVGVLVDVANDVELIVVDVPKLDVPPVALDVNAPACLFLYPHDHTMLTPSSQNISLIDRLAVRILETDGVHEFEHPEVYAQSMAIIEVVVLKIGQYVDHSLSVFVPCSKLHVSHACGIPEILHSWQDVAGDLVVGPVLVHGRMNVS